MIYDLTPFTLIDYPNKIAAIVWFGGCNMRCLYCYNPQIVYSSESRINKEEIIHFLKERKGLLDGVVYCGGEPTNYREIIELSVDIKSLGFLIKLDTNGTNPDILKNLIDIKLIDYVALDIKAPYYKYEKITGYKNFYNIEKSLDILINSNIDYEIRTTVHADLISEEDINQIIDLLERKGFRKTYYLQNYLHAENIGNLAKPKKGFNFEKLKNSYIRLGFRNF